MNIIERLEAMDNEHTIRPTIHFGKHNGVAYEDLPIGYLIWLQRKNIERENVKRVLLGREEEIIAYLDNEERDNNLCTCAQDDFDSEWSFPDHPMSAGW